MPDGTEIPVQQVDGSIRTIGEKSGNLVTLAIENWTSEQIVYVVLFKFAVLRHILTFRRPICRARELGMFSLSQGHVSNVIPKRLKILKLKFNFIFF